MKNIAVFTVLLILLLCNTGTAQTATGGCTSVTVSNIPSFPVVYFANVGYSNCTETSSCEDGGESPCCRWITSGNPTTPRFWLEKLTNTGWVTVAGPQFSTTFNNLALGSYRVKCQVPTISENICKKDGQGNIIRARICLFNQLGQFIGFWGTWDNTPFGTTPPTYTNTVLVGATTSNDISYTFIDPTPNDPFEMGYDFGEMAKINTAACGAYDLWWLAIFEDGPTYNRYRSNNWTNGRMPNDEFNLTNFWGQGGSGWNFETFHSYTVQFVIENSRCRNGIEQNPPAKWNNLDRSFFICTAGTGCRFGADDKEIVISPNPATSTIWLQNFEPDLDRDYQMSFSDLAGRLVKFVALTSNEVDISDIPAGMFVLTVRREGRQVFTSKLVVNR